MNRNVNILALFGTWLLVFTGFVLSMFVLFLIMKLIFIPVFEQRWFELLFYIAMVSVPFVLFEFVYIVFFRRTKNHPSPAIRLISKFLFVAGMSYCLLIYILDFISFFKKEYYAITEFRSFDLRFLCVHIFGLFAIAILQALTTEKEIDWTQKDVNR
ncbi:MAG: hypothetical protein ABJA78_19080 [Ferruginibacter sp.]